jgi:hypothetical protein
MGHSEVGWAVWGGGRPGLAGLVGCTKNRKKEEEKGKAGRAGLQGELGFGPRPFRDYKFLLFFKSFYNLQTNLNSFQI